MDRVFSQEQRPVADLTHAAIAIRAIDSEQRHIGILHRKDDSVDVRLLHLAWHHDLRDHSPSPEYHWIALAVPARRLRQVAAICRKVSKSNAGTLPYALSPPNDCFDAQTGDFLLGSTRHGLTCASFVLAVFETAGLRLVQYESWPTRSGDQEWQSWVVAQLENSLPPASQKHINAVRGEIGASRYRPEDVAAATLVSSLPADFESIAELAAEIISRLENT